MFSLLQGRLLFQKRQRAEKRNQRSENRIRFSIRISAVAEKPGSMGNRFKLLTEQYKQKGVSEKLKGPATRHCFYIIRFSRSGKMAFSPLHSKMSSSIPRRRSLSSKVLSGWAGMTRTNWGRGERFTLLIKSRAAPE